MLDLVEQAVRDRFGDQRDEDCTEAHTADAESESVIQHRTTATDAKRTRRNDRGHTKNLVALSTQANGRSQRMRIVRFDGSMSQMQRNIALTGFQNDPCARILLISLKCGDADTADANACCVLYHNDCQHEGHVLIGVCSGRGEWVLTSQLHQR